MFRLAPLLIASTAGEADETSLMQGVKPPQIIAKEDKSKSVTSLLETAKTMLKNGATPDVTAFATATLEAITNGEDGVLSKIQDAHDADERLITQTHRMFQDAFDELVEGTTHISTLYNNEQGHRTDYRTCRGVVEERTDSCTTEYCHCEDKRDCDYEIWKTWTHFAWEESDLRFKSGEIENHFCTEGANGTTWVFRDYSVAKFPSWIVQKGVVDRWETSYETWRVECEARNSALNRKNEECDGYQQHLEEASCVLANRMREVKNAFARFWIWATRTYQEVMDDVHCLEIDRWKEWRSLKTVECLLDRIRERNGRPCEESTNEFETEATHCEQVQVDEDIDHLRIEYPDIPDYPDPCATPGAGGICVPDPVPVACEEDLDLPAGQSPSYNQVWVNQFYQGLWTPPTPDYHAPTYHVDNHFEPVTQSQHHGRCGSGACDDEEDDSSHLDIHFTSHWDELVVLRDTGNAACPLFPGCLPCTLEPLAEECETISLHERDARNTGRRGSRWVRYPEPAHECTVHTERQIRDEYGVIRTDGYLSNVDLDNTDQGYLSNDDLHARATDGEGAVYDGGQWHSIDQQVD